MCKDSGVELLLFVRRDMYDVGEGKRVAGNGSLVGVDKFQVVRHG